MSLLNRLSQHFLAPGSGLGLGLFRIGFGLVLQAEILQLFYFHDLIYGHIPGDTWSLDGNFKFLFLFWWVVVLLITLGIKVRVVTIINYALSVTFLGTFAQFEYHVDYYFIGASFLLMFLPAHTAFSAHLPRSWYKTKPPEPQSVTWGFVALFGAFSIGFVYIDSIFTKLDSKMWLAGLGLYTPASLPMVSWVNLDPLLDQEWLIKGMGFSVLLFELVFLFLLPFQKFRPWLALFGFTFHVGICIAFPIPWFGLAVAVYYLMLLPDRLWQRFFALLRLEWLANPPQLDADRAKRLLPWGVLFTVIACLIQLVLSLTHPIVQKRLPEALNSWVTLARNTIHPWTREFLGMTRHGVFMDGHFANYNHVVAVVHVRKGKEKWLPLVTKEGRPGSYQLGRTWVYFTFRVNGHTSRKESLERGLRRLTWFWCVKNRVHMKDAEFIVKVKKVTVPFEWQKDITEEQRASPWIDVGRVSWKDFQCEIQTPDIETL
jgi:hypothetical protein